MALEKEGDRAANKSMRFRVKRNLSSNPNVVTSMGPWEVS